MARKRRRCKENAENKREVRCSADEAEAREKIHSRHPYVVPNSNIWGSRVSTGMLYII